MLCNTPKCAQESLGGNTTIGEERHAMLMLYQKKMMKNGEKVAVTTREYCIRNLVVVLEDSNVGGEERQYCRLH